MNLCEARKLGHEGWVRSPTRTGGRWATLWPYAHIKDDKGAQRSIVIDDLDAADWEPMPAPPRPFEAILWVHLRHSTIHRADAAHTTEDWVTKGWRKVRVREVVE